MSDFTVPQLPSTLTPYPVVANITFPEGPTFDDRGNIYFVNYLEAGTIGRMSPDGTVEVWVHTGGGAGGLKYDGRGHIVERQGALARYGPDIARRHSLSPQGREQKMV